MKRILLFISLPFIAFSFAGTYTIPKFSAEDVGTPDSYIQAEFGGELKKASPTAVLDIQKGRLFVRQKFEDPFGEDETVYQIYQGRAGDLSSLMPLQAPPSLNYAKLLNLKMYLTKNEDIDEDIEKVYFDGKSIFIDGASTAFVSVNGTMVELKPQTAVAPPPVVVPPPPAPKAVAAVSSYDDDEYDDDEYEDDEYEDDVVAPPPVVKQEKPFIQEKPIAEPKPIVAPKLYEDDEDDDEYEECEEGDKDCDSYEYDVAGDLNKTNSYADEMDYAASSAASDVKDRFGIADEVRFWSAVAFATAAAGSAIAGVLQHMKANEARDAFDQLSELRNSFMSQVKAQCAPPNEDPTDPAKSAKCETAMIWDLSNNGINVGGETFYTLNELNSRIATNKKTMNSYALYRNVWFGVTAASLTASIVLFVW